jgi:hypothetical protein
MGKVRKRKEYSCILGERSEHLDSNEEACLVYGTEFDFDNGSKRWDGYMTITDNLTTRKAPCHVPLNILPK